MKTPTDLLGIVVTGCIILTLLSMLIALAKLLVFGTA